MRIDLMVKKKKSVKTRVKYYLKIHNHLTDNSYEIKRKNLQLYNNSKQHVIRYYLEDEKSDQADNYQLTMMKVTLNTRTQKKKYIFEPTSATNLNSKTKLELIIDDFEDIRVKCNGSIYYPEEKFTKRGIYLR